MSDYIGLNSGSEEIETASVDSSFQKCVCEREVRADGRRVWGEGRHPSMLMGRRLTGERDRWEIKVREGRIEA